MAGFDNDVVYGSNVDFTGTFPVSGQINLDGELLIGASVAPFIRAGLLTGSGGITITNGPGTIDIDGSGVGGGVTSVSGTANRITSTGGTTPVINIAPTYVGQTSITTLGTVTTGVWNGTTIAVANGGTGATTLTNHGVLLGQGTSPVVATAAGSAGQVLQSGGASADPAYSTATFPATATGTGTILRADGTNWVASTPTFPNAASTAGKVIVSDGTNFITSTPTFPNASATSGKIIKSDGTNWVASTETYAAPGTSGNVMTSNGTNWTSATPAGGLGSLNFIEGTLTSAQIKALRASPVQVVAAPGANRVVIVAHFYATMTYGGTNVFVAGAGQTIDLFWGTAVSIAQLLTNGQIVASSSTMNYSADSITAGSAITSKSNAAVNIYNSVATEITGNAANNNTMSYGILYYIVTI